ncbi:MAG TPA: PD-(D/E)XK nuclease family protein [Steroidobacteraceae bacterium]|nr:PD-(D/E)XK nuclease family protein [Steroidobacteraceae bacterium]
MTVFDALADELPAGVTVVTPTRRLAHQLRARHDAACVARGLPAWRTPDVVTWSELLQRQFETDRAAGRTCQRWLAPSHARLVWERLVRRDSSLAGVLAPAGLGAVAYRSWELVHQYQVPYAALDSADGAEGRAFARWVAEYRQWLQLRGWLDPALAASSVGPLPADARVQFVGFDRWTPEQSTFVERLRQHGTRVEVTPRLDESAPMTAEVVDCNDFDDEIETAARWIAQYLQARPQARVALVVPALARERARVRRVLDRLLVPATAVTGGPAPESAAYELAAARPLIERPVVAAALGWVEAGVGTASLPAMGGLLLGAHDGAATAEACVRAELDVQLRRLGRPVRKLGDIAAESWDACPATAQRLERAAARCRGWTGQRLPSQWALEFVALLREIGWPGEDPGSAEHQAVQRWQRLLGEFGASDDVTGPMRARAAVAQLRDLAQDTAFEPQEIAAPILVIDPETALGMRFDAAWICGLDATRWPGPASPDPFLPRDVQARAGLPGSTAEFVEAETRRTLQRLTHAAPTVICSVPRFEDEAPLLPSAYVADLPRRDALELWTGSSAASALFQARPPLESFVDSTLPAFAANQLVKGGTRLLELQAACPFRAAIELRLGGSELASATVGIAPTERGKLVHAVLQAFWHEVREQSALLAMSVDERAARIDALATQTFWPLRAAADEVRGRLLSLEQRWIVTRVLELLEQDARREPFTVEFVEEPRVVDVGGVQIKVQLDRVDRLVDGSYAVIDYKTGGSARPAAWMGERPELPQLPLYVRTVGRDTVSAVAFGVVRTGGTGYAGFARSAGVFSALETFQPRRLPFKEYADWEAMLQQWGRRLDALAHEHATGDARLAPNPTRACRYCHLPGLCRSTQAFADGAEEVDDAAG